MKAPNPETVVLNVATLGPLGRSVFGRFFAPLLAVPVVFLGRYIYATSKDLFYIPMIILIVGIIWVVNFAYENLPLERTDNIILPMIPGMAEALLHLPLLPKIITISFFIFSFVHFSLEKLVERFSDDSGQKVRSDEMDHHEFDDQEDVDGSETYALPPSRHKNLYEILMLPIGSGVITSFLVHAALLLAKKL